MCASLPSSVLRLATDEPLDSRTELQVTHRADISLRSCACQKCSARKTVGDLVLPQGKRPSLIFSFLNFGGGNVLQKYYKIAVHLADAVVPPETIKSSSSEASITKSSYTQVMEFGVFERQKQPWDDIIQINGLMDPNNADNVTRFSLTYWVVIWILVALILVFSGCILWSLIDEYRPQGPVCEPVYIRTVIILEHHRRQPLPLPSQLALEQRRAQFRRMFLKDGYINPYILPESVAKNATIGW